jgi:DNA-binding MarR family transcriptional regulator
MIDQTSPAELRKSIELFYFAYRAFTCRADRILAERGLGRVHHRILYFVGRNPDVAVNALLGILQVSKQALNGPLRQLTEMQLVSAAVAGHDRRVKLLRLTEAGEKLEARLTGAQMEHLAAVFEAAGPGAAADWQKVMAALARETLS